VVWYAVDAECDLVKKMTTNIEVRGCVSPLINLCIVLQFVYILRIDSQK